VGTGVLITGDEGKRPGYQPSKCTNKFAVVPGGWQRLNGNWDIHDAAALSDAGKNTRAWQTTGKAPNTKGGS